MTHKPYQDWACLAVAQSGTCGLEHGHPRLGTTGLRVQSCLPRLSRPWKLPDKWQQLREHASAGRPKHEAAQASAAARPVIRLESD